MHHGPGEPPGGPAGEAGHLPGHLRPPAAAAGAGQRRAGQGAASLGGEHARSSTLELHNPSIETSFENLYLVIHVQLHLKYKKKVIKIYYEALWIFLMFVDLRQFMESLYTFSNNPQTRLKVSLDQTFIYSLFN